MFCAGGNGYSAGSAVDAGLTPWSACAVNARSVQPSAGVALFGAACIYAALRLYGFYHVDELGQISMFALYKLGIATAADLPWEFAQQMRPWLQPAIYLAVLKPWIAMFGYDFPTAERLMVVVQLVLLCAALPLFLRAVPRPAGPACQQAVYRFGTLALLVTWFVPSMIMRHASEAFAVLWLAIGVGLWQRVEDAEQPRGWVALGSGLAAGLAFASRYQVGLFVAGFWIARAVGSRRERRLRSALVWFAGGVVLSLAVALAVDAWGYGQFTLTPWNYLRENVLFDQASRFGRSPWYFYLLEASLLTLNPLFFVWLARAAVVSWREPFARALVVGLLVFLAVHCAIPHKEVRFLLPMWPVAVVLLAKMFGTDALRDSGGAPAAGPGRFGRVWRALFGVGYIRVVALANLVALIGFCAFGLVRDRYRSDLVLWALPPGTTVLSPANLYRTFDDALGPPPPPLSYSQSVRRPTYVRLVYAPVPALAPTCVAQPKALVLLTNQAPDPATRALMNRDYSPVVADSPGWAWLEHSALMQRMWQFKLVSCASFLAAPEL